MLIKDVVVISSKTQIVSPQDWNEWDINVKQSSRFLSVISLEGNIEVALPWKLATDKITLFAIEIKHSI